MSGPNLINIGVSLTNAGVSLTSNTGGGFPWSSESIKGVGVSIVGTIILLSDTSIEVGSATGTLLGTATVVGVTGTPTWSLSDPSSTFTINATTGAVTVANTLDLANVTTLPIVISETGTNPVPPSGDFGISVFTTAPPPTGAALMFNSAANSMYVPLIFGSLF